MLPVKRLRRSAGVFGASTKPGCWLLFCGVPETSVLLFVKYSQCKFLSILSTSRGMAQRPAPLPPGNLWAHSSPGSTFPTAWFT